MDDSTENAAAGPLGGREGGAAAGAATTNANGALDSVNGQGSAAAGAAPPTPVTPMPPSGAGGAAGAGSVNGAASSTLRHQQNGGSAQQQQQHGAGHDAANGSNGTISGKTFATKRSRLVGLNHTGYGPLGASSPSLSSNVSSFGGAGTSPSSGSSSNTTTPSASPSQSNAQLPPLASSQNSYGGLPQGASQQHHHSSGYGATGHSGGAGSSTSASNPPPYPSLHLHPLNDTFVPKQISLYPPGPNNRIKIGRQTNVKTVPAPNNAYFDSKVLSRMHAEVWCEDNKVFIKDVKSSNGTFINGERLSPEAVESDIFQLHSNDMVEFGIDITSEDTKTIVHHKVAARCFLVMNAEDAAQSSRYANMYRDLGDSPLHRRAGLGGGKGMGGSGLNMDQVLNRLQTELSKSRDTGQELSTLNGAIGEIHESLGGSVPGQQPTPAYRVPLFVPPNASSLSSQQAAQQQQQQTQQLLTNLQRQLQETQDALNGNVERIRNLEGLLSEQDRMKSELRDVKHRMEEARQEWEELKESKERALHHQDDHSPNAMAEELDDDEEKEDLDLAGDAEADNTRTIRLVDGLDDLAQGDDAARAPGSGGAETGTDARVVHEATEKHSLSALSEVQQRLEAENTALSQRMETLSSELSTASELSTSLKTQYVQAADTIRLLEEKVRTLEEALQKQSVETREAASAASAATAAATASAASAAAAAAVSQTQSTGPTAPASGPTPAQVEATLSAGKAEIMREVQTRFTDWQKSFEEAVKQERATWEEERERLRISVQEWERRSTALEKQAAAIDASASGSGSSRRKRRSKASTVGTSSEEETSESDSAGTGEGFASPVTDDSTIRSVDLPPIAEEEVTGVTKSRSSSRRAKGKRGRKTRESTKGSSGTPGRPQTSNQPAPQSAGVIEGGSAPERRRSWIPFSMSSDEAPSVTGTGGRHPLSRSKDGKGGRTVFEHPAMPIVSAAGIVVISYLAYTAVMQHQK